MNLKRKWTLIASISLTITTLGAVAAWSGSGEDALDAFVVGNFAHAFALAQPAAEKEDALAQYVIARSYADGKGVKRNEIESAKWFEKALRLARPAAQKGDSRHQFVMGSMYQLGKGAEKDEAAAATWYRKAAEQGFAPAQNNLGAFFYMTGAGGSKDEGVAVSWVRKAAEQGFAPAQANLGIFYAMGTGVIKDDTAAFTWTRKAAEQGVPQAQSNLGVMYATGAGVTEDEDVAVTWYRKAAEQGAADGQFKLGLMYTKGHGVPKDYIKAYAWYLLASANGQADTRDIMNSLRSVMTGEQIKEAQKIASSFSPVSGMSSTKSAAPLATESHHTALDGDLDSTDTKVEFRGFQITKTNLDLHLQALMDTLAKNHSLETLTVKRIEPNIYNTLKRGEFYVQAIALGYLSSDAHQRDEAAKDIARTIYLMTYPIEHRTVTVDMFLRPKDGWNEKFDSQTSIRRGADIDNPSAILFTRDEHGVNESMKTTKKKIVK